MEVLPWLYGFVSVRDYTAFAGELFLLCINFSLSFTCPFKLMMRFGFVVMSLGVSTKCRSVELLSKLVLR